jgi:hypothetical protein
MSTALPAPQTIREQFFARPEADGGWWEFDCSEPVAMPAGTVNHRRIRRNLLPLRTGHQDDALARRAADRAGRNDRTAASTTRD